MMDITENTSEGLYDMLQQGNEISNEDLNKLCYYFNELLEASLIIQYKIETEAKKNGNLEKMIIAKGFDELIKEYHKGFLDLKKKYKWDSNIGEEL